VYYRIWCSALVVLAVVVCSWGTSCMHSMKVELNSNFHTVHTVCAPAPHNHSKHNQCRTPYVEVRSLVLLKLGIVMPETC